MKKSTFVILAFLIFSMASGQELKPLSEIGKLSDPYKARYFDEVSTKIDTLSGIRTYEVSGYISLRHLPDSSPVFKMIQYYKSLVATLDSGDLRRGHTFNIHPVKFSDTLFFRNTYFSKEGQIVKMKNVISVPNLTNEALVYYSDAKPFKIFWAVTKTPYLMIYSFYYFDGKNISDNSWEGFRSYSPFEYQRAIDLFEEFKNQVSQ